jgi:dipeptidase D
MSIETLKPERIWHFFAEICKVPRPSKKEEKIMVWLMEFGQSRGLETLKDKAGNVLIRKPASNGYEKRPWVCLQSHMDMVCEKNSDVIHDFEKDSIQPWIDGEWVKAKGTTLGADDGIGMAAQLAILDDKTLEHGPIECLFTVDEETGLTGAFALQPGFLKSLILLNLDSEDEGEFCIGCAGGRDTQAFFDFSKTPVDKGTAAFRINVSGLRGGHSGDDISKGLGNANKIMNRFLWNAERMFGLRLSHIEGGNLHNAIARESYAMVTIPESNKQAFLDFVNVLAENIKIELATNEPGLQIITQQADMPDFVIDQDTQKRFLNAVYACPHGVIAMSPDIPGLVETSTNLASVKMNENKIIVNTSQRSSVASSKKDIVDMMDSVFLSMGASTTHGDGYPGWKPNMNSPLIGISKESYKNLFGKEPRFMAIHAGLECGLIGEKYEGMDMISFGPTLRGVHSPAEKLEIASVQKFWDFLLAILKSMK